MSDTIKVNTAHSYPANQSVVELMLSQPIDSVDGRSEWRWFWLGDGSVVLGFFPTGEGYEASEVGREEDYNFASYHDNIQTIESELEFELVGELKMRVKE